MNALRRHRWATWDRAAVASALAQRADERRYLVKRIGAQVEMVERHAFSVA